MSCQELITSLPEDSDACMRNEVTFTCTIRGSSNLTSSIIAWRSSEYIGKGDALQFTSEDMAGTNSTSMINGNVTAILTNNTGIGGAVRVPVLVSKLRIVNADQNSMITCNSLTSGSSASTEFDGSGIIINRSVRVIAYWYALKVGNTYGWCYKLLALLEATFL